MMPVPPPLVEPLPLVEPGYRMQVAVRPRSYLYDLVDFCLTDANWKSVWGYPKDVLGCVWLCPVSCVSPTLYFLMRFLMLAGWGYVLEESWRLWSLEVPFGK